MGREIVIKSFNGIGDLLFVTPTLRRIKEAYPDSRIRVNTNHPGLLMGNPYVDEIGADNTPNWILGYADPIHCKLPVKHHIQADWEIVQERYNLMDLQPPDLKPELFLEEANARIPKTDVIGVQISHKGHWHAKKVWPKFEELLQWRTEGLNFQPIPARLPNSLALAAYVSGCRAFVCAEGGISHLARALDVPAVVLYGGFARPEWNGYKEQINICNEKWCSFCYNTKPCLNKIERFCMKEITVESVVRSVEGLKKIPELEQHNAMQFVKEDAIKWCNGVGIDVGSGGCPFPGAKAIDEGDNENAYIIREEDETYDYVFSSHCLEHLNSPKAALQEWLRVLKRGGILYLYLPHPDYIPWRTATMPKWHKQDFQLWQVVQMLEGETVTVLEVVERDWYFGQKIVARK